MAPEATISADDAGAPPAAMASLTLDETNGAAELPAHRSHDPAKNLKRSDPFQFGSRLLNEGDDVFEFNAWDHVETDDAYKEYTEKQMEMQRQSPVSDFDKSTSDLHIFNTLWLSDDTHYQCIVHLKRLMSTYLQFFRSHLIRQISNSFNLVKIHPQLAHR